MEQGVRGTEGNRRLVIVKCGEASDPCTYVAKRRRANSISTSVITSLPCSSRNNFNSQFTLFIEIVMEQTDAGMNTFLLPRNSSVSRSAPNEHFAYVNTTFQIAHAVSRRIPTLPRYRRVVVPSYCFRHNLDEYDSSTSNWWWHWEFAGASMPKKSE